MRHSGGRGRQRPYGRNNNNNNNNSNNNNNNYGFQRNHPSSTQLATPQILHHAQGHTHSHTFSPSPSSSQSSSKNKVLVVGFIGKNKNGVRINLLNEIIEIPVFKTLPLAPNPLTSLHPHIDMYHDTENNIIYLNLVSLIENTSLMLEGVEAYEIFSNFSNTTNSSDGVMDAHKWLEDHQEYHHIKVLLYMFLVCHVIVVSNPSLTIDLGFIRTLRIVDSLKFSLGQYSITPFLASLSHTHTSDWGRGALNSWFFPGRCIPLLIFVFSLPRSLTVQLSQTPTPSIFFNYNTPETSTSSPPVDKIEKIEASLDAQLRSILKKARLYNTDLPTHSFHHSHYGHHNYDNTQNTTPLFIVDSNLGRLVKVLFESPPSLLSQFSPLAEKIGISDFLNTNTAAKPIAVSSASILRDILLKISKQLTLGRGFSNVNINSSSVDSEPLKQAATVEIENSENVTNMFEQYSGSNVGGGRVSFELPSAKTWYFLSNSLQELFVKDIPRKKKKFPPHHYHHFRKAGGVGMAGSNDPSTIYPTILSERLQSIMDPEYRFSKARCLAALPLARETYLLPHPPYYTFQVHERQLQKAVQVFLQHARGPACEYYTRKLTDECTYRVWMGKQQCEVKSLTGRNCVLKLNHEKLEKLTTAPPLIQSIPPQENQIYSLAAYPQTTTTTTATTTTTTTTPTTQLQQGGVAQNIQENYRALEERPFSHDQSGHTFEPQPTDPPNVVQHPETPSQVILPHTSGNRTLSTCNCGVSQILREDPFDLDTANYRFYSNFEDFPCCAQSKVEFHSANCTDPEGNCYVMGEITKSEDEQNNSRERSMIPSSNYQSHYSWSLCVLGPASAYDHNVGITQNGIIANHQYLTPLDHLIHLPSIQPEQSTAQTVIHYEESFPPLSVGEKSQEKSVKPNYSVGQSNIDKRNVVTPANFSSQRNRSRRYNRRNGGYFEDDENTGNNNNNNRGRGRGWQRERERREKLMTPKGFIGFEYECMYYGHRFFFHISKTHHRSHNSHTHVTIRQKDTQIPLSTNTEPVENEDEKTDEGSHSHNTSFPVYTACISCKGNIAQLMRAYVATPDIPQQISLSPRIVFSKATKSHLTSEIIEEKWAFDLGKEVVLPRDSFVVLRLPYIYASNVQPLVMTSPTTPYHVHVSLQLGVK